MRRLREGGGRLSRAEGPGPLELAVGAAPKIELASGIGFTAFAAVLTILFFRRVLLNVRGVRGDKFDFSNW